MQVDKRVAFVVRKLNSAGYQAYLVGGCVRDFLLDNTPKDWDVATSAKPEAILACFVEDMHVIETGLKHGTVTIMSGGLPIEVTTFRTDGVYTDNRRPVAVTFVDELKKDLARRDFTMNALAYDLCENIDTGTHVNANNAKTVNPGSVRADYCTFDSDDVSVTGDICSTICRVDCDGCRDICGVAIRSVVGSDCSNINDGAIRGVDVDSGAIRSVVSADCGNLGEASGIAEASVIAEASDNMVDCKIIDYFDGARDLKNCLIRAVGNPEMRLKE
ncbi:MAG: hypothetical protein LBN22_05010, partial [Clostridiales Family XIII bacterium]|nr:hypothetical protein [Clostridiales Family XIII bacterium]